MTTKSITLDVWQSNDVRVKVNQGEIDSRFLQIKITDKNKAFDLADKTVIFYATKPDGNLIFNYCEIIDAQKGVVNLAMTSQMSIAPGIMRDCEINIIDAGVTKLKVKGLSIEIVRCTDFDAAVESTSEFTALDEALADVQAVMDAYSEENIMKKITSMDGEGSGLDADLLDGKHGKDYATAEQGKKADTALQGIKVNGETIPASSDGVVEITISDTSNAVLGIQGNGSMIPKDKNNVVNITPHIIGAVPVTRTINGYSLADNVTISMSDFGGATAEQGAKADSAIQGVKVDGILLSPDNQNVVNVDTSVIDCATSEQGSKADSAIQGVKLNGTTITPDSQKVVNVQINETTVNTYTATIGANWTTTSTGEYSQTISTPGILSTDNPIVDVVLSSEKELALSQLEAWSCVSKIETQNGSITATCLEDMPELALPIQLKVVR